MGLLRAVGRNALILLVCFALLEIGTRTFVRPEDEPARAVTDLDPEHRIAFLPHRERVYTTSELRFTARTNAQGRRDVEWTPAVIANPDNILFVGDSMIYGYGVDHESTIPTLLEARLAQAGQPREVFNFGMPATSLPEYTLLLDDALRIGIRARTVLLGITVGNDFDTSVLAPPAPPPEASPPPAPPRVPLYKRSAFLGFLERRASNSSRVIGLTLTIGRWLGLTVYDTAGSYVFLREQTPEQEALFQRILDVTDRIADTCRAKGRTLYVVILPNKIQVENGDDLTGAVYDAAKPDRLLLEKCAGLGLTCLDLLPVLMRAHAEGGEPLFFRLDRHHTPAGNRVAAEAIFSFLEAAWRAALPPSPGSVS